MILDDGVHVQLTHLRSGGWVNMHGNDVAGYTSKTFCGKWETASDVFRLTTVVADTTCEKCKSDYALDLLGALP